MKIKLVVFLLLLLTSLFSVQTALEVKSDSFIPASVSITGDVKDPGIYTLTTMNRVTEALALASIQAYALSSAQQIPSEKLSLGKTSFKLPASVDSVQATVYGQRNVILNRQGQLQTLDILKFFRLGDISQNPYLKDGDIIIVTPVNNVISVQGSARRPGDYEFREGDTVKDMLDLALGVTVDADLRYVLLYRYNDNYSEFTKTELDVTGYPAKTNAALQTVLMHGDRILIPANTEFRKAYKVQVSGKAKLQGMYYVNDNTTLYDLLVMSGGPTKEADLGNSFVYNRLVSENYDPDFERLSKYSYNQMTWLEYSYLRTKTRQLKGKYSIDIEKCWQTKGQEANLVLRDGDEVIIPEKVNGVWVAGQVRFPGLVTWHKDMKWKDYLASAGGYANNRKLQGTRIIRVHSGNWVKPTDNIKLNPGDIIFIPDKEERYFWADFKDFILVASQLITIVLAYTTIKERI
jgi:protein involved in polysaccharide export with SLBB domain